MLQSLFETICSYAEEQKAKEVTKVILKFGPLSGIEPGFFRTAFDTFKEGSIAGKADLLLNKEAMTLKCNDCDYISKVDGLFFKCCGCGSVNVEVADDGGLILERLEMKVDEEIDEG